MSTSVLNKARAYCEFYRHRRPSAEYPHGQLEVIEAAIQEGNTALLRAYGRELDVRIRELLSTAEQLELRAMMRRKGVAATHLPSLRPLSTVRTVIARGHIRSAKEFEAVRPFVDPAAQEELSKRELRMLGRLVDEYSTRGAAA
jgi:cytosine/adenosine deaminase-related metal-dependent hydrolase